MTAGFRAYRCETTDDPPPTDITTRLAHDLAYSPQIYDQLGPIELGRAEAHPGGSDYHVFIYASWRWSRLSKFDPFADHEVDWPNYDLEKEPANICIAVGGATELELGNLLPDHFTSNTVLIPAKQVRDAFADYERSAP